MDIVLDKGSGTVLTKKGIIARFPIHQLRSLVDSSILTEEDAEVYTLEDITHYQSNGFSFLEYDSKQISFFDWEEI